MLLWAISLTALGGYGEVVLGDDGDAYPSWAERDVHMWTNIVRVDPEVFFGRESSWDTPCDIDEFQASETTPKLPLYYDFDLNDAGRFHSIDMYDNEWFDHASSDGTSFPDRMARFYDESGMLGENIAAGYSDGEAVILQGWMCSAGHRANIMNADYNELGVGVKGLYFTQDFAFGTAETTAPIAMGLHSPEYPTGTVEFLVDFQGDAPDSISVVVNGRDTPVELLFGTSSNGVFQTQMTTAGEIDCHQYYFQWERGYESGTFPEEGSYLFGTDCRSSTMWIDSQVPIGGSAEAGAGMTDEDIQEEAQWQLDKSDVDVVGCSCATRPPTAGSPRFAALIGMWLFIGGLMIRRRRG